MSLARILQFIAKQKHTVMPGTVRTGDCGVEKLGAVAADLVTRDEVQGAVWGGRGGTEAVP
jgi:hypothetical protein